MLRCAMNPDRDPRMPYDKYDMTDFEALVVLATLTAFVLVPMALGYWRVGCWLVGL